MKKIDLEDVDKIVISNHENRQSFLDMMRIAYDAATNRCHYEIYQEHYGNKVRFDRDGYTDEELKQFDSFDEWIKFVKRKLDK